ncbi:hypothetical protein Afil01_47740 [Actinorhabdospora filicis]|uniref:Uncharacterized protein n=1 Tax=Actinorhabdospora filicis TaxID=1785913 RepID=A0A9W6SQE5_9ACTN|nr:hypothetical protein Afil01_47740 [Actinorhabdospora filicis]
MAAHALLRLQRAAGNRATGLLLSVQRDAMTQYEDKDWHAAAWVLKDFPHDKAIARVKGLSASRRNRLAEGAMHSPAWRETVLGLVEAVDRNAALIGRARYHLWKDEFAIAAPMLVKLDDATIRTVLRQRYGKISFEQATEMTEVAGSKEDAKRLRYLLLSGPELPHRPQVTFLPKDSHDLLAGYAAGSPLLRGYAAAKWGAKGPPRMRMIEDAAWVEFAAGQCAGRENPKTGKPMTPEELRREVANWGGFTDSASGLMYMRHSDYIAGAAIHELVHALAGAGFLHTIGFDANEGATEYFARRAAGELKVAPSDSYPKQHEVIASLAGYVGEELVTAAFFGGGNTSAIASEVNAKHAPPAVRGPGPVTTAWIAWLNLVEGPGQDLVEAAAFFGTRGIEPPVLPPTESRE